MAKERLGLEISPEKSRIVNLKKQYSEFLGFKLKLCQKSKKWILKSHLSDKALATCNKNIRYQIHRIGKQPNQWSVMNFNAAILGYHNYYKYATNVYVDFDRIAFDVRKSLLCRTKTKRNKFGRRSKAFEQYYGDFTGKIFNVAGLALFPINGIKTVPPMCFSSDVCSFSEKGRKKIHSLQKAISPWMLQQLLKYPVQGRSTEFNDNRISLYIAQRGKCAITGIPLVAGEIVVHHKIPVHLQGGDSYSNLILLCPAVHQLIHGVSPEIIQKYLLMLQGSTIDFVKLNKMRELVDLCEIGTNR